MRAFVIGVAALAFGATLSACSSNKSAALEPVKTDPAAVEKLVAELTAGTFKGKATAAADVAAVRDALPKEIALSWGSLTFDQASGATVLTAVKLTPADTPAVGLSVDEVRLWDFNTDFAKARLAGQRLTETASLASRAELKGLSVFGLETLMAPTMEAYTDAVAGTIVASAPHELATEIKASMATALDSYEFSVGRVIIDDLTLRPYELKLVNLPPEHEFAEAMPVLQPLAATWRSFAANAVAVSDINGRMAMTQMGQPTEVGFSAATYGARGVRGGDNDAGFIRNITFDMNVPAGMSVDASASAVPLTKMNGSIEYISMQDVRFDKLYGYLARGEWPPRTEKDLLSYGLITAKNEKIGANGRDFMVLGEMVLDAREWHWFVPTKASFKMSDLAYDIKALMEFAAETAAPMQIPVADPNNPEGTAIMVESAVAPIDPAMMDLLVRYGLDKPSIDIAFGWDWNSATGATAIDGALGLDNYFTADMKYEGEFPSFKAVSDLIPEDADQADSVAVGALFEKASMMKLVSIEVVDNGGLQKSFALATEIAKMQPSTPDMPNPMANMTAEQMRSMASAAIYLGADQASSQVPSAGALIRPLAAFIEKGGRVKITSAPKEPVQVVTIAGTPPDAAIEQLNIKVEHMPPAGK